MTRRRVYSTTLIVVFSGSCLLTMSLLTIDANAQGLPDNPTMNLSAVTQNWDKNLPSSSRFTVLSDFKNQAVRDNETGLVWQTTPFANAVITWSTAVANCSHEKTGGRQGWRLPSFHELASLKDASQPTGLPAGHPFDVGVGNPLVFWSATTWAVDLAQAWKVDFSPGSIAPYPEPKTSSGIRMWCVRGGGPIAAY